MYLLKRIRKIGVESILSVTKLQAVFAYSRELIPEIMQTCQMQVILTSIWMEIILFLMSIRIYMLVRLRKP